MPLYEYKCQGCGQVFEIIQRFSDEPLSTHEACGGSVERLISAPGLHFKGSGWYITDYARGGGASAANGNKNGESKSAESKSGDSKSGDSKPAASSTESSTKSTASSSTEKK